MNRFALLGHRRRRPPGVARRPMVVRPSLVDTPRWGPRHAVVGYVAAVVSATLAAGVASAFGQDSTSLVGVTAGVTGMWAGFLGAPTVASWREGRSHLRQDFGLSCRVADGVVGVPLGALTQLALVPAGYIPVRWVAGDLDVSAPARELSERAEGSGLLVLVVVVVIGAPIAEELFFRGLVLRAAIRRVGRTPGVLVATTVFAASHFQPVQFPGLFVAGLVFATLTVASDRLGPAIWAHASYNAVSFIVLSAS